MVLVVEDEVLVQMLILEVLDELGVDALDAGDGLAALEILRSDARIDLMITDMGLPGMNGSELVGAACSVRPELKVLVVTGDSNGWKMDNPQDGVAAVISKPFTLDELADGVRRILAEAAAEPLAEPLNGADGADW